MEGSVDTVKTKIKKNDIVQVISGKQKGEKGKVLKVDREKGRIFVEKVNVIKRHLRPSAAHRQGGIVEKEGPVNISNVMLLCPKCKLPTRSARGFSKTVPRFESARSVMKYLMISKW